MSAKEGGLRASIKERLKELAATHKAALKSDGKKEAYLAKLKAFYKETEPSDTVRWVKLDVRLKDFEQKLSPQPQVKPTQKNAAKTPLEEKKEELNKSKSEKSKKQTKVADTKAIAEKPQADDSSTNQS